MSRGRLQRWSLGLIALFMLPTAIQATFAPESWFDDFPLGRGWVAAEGGSYDEHLVRDVGVLFLALIVATAWSVWRREAMTIMAIAWLIQGVFHVGYHIGHLDGLEYRRPGRVGRFAHLDPDPRCGLAVGRSSNTGDRMMVSTILVRPVHVVSDTSCTCHPRGDLVRLF